jgi:four helix bundle protein
MEDLKIRQKCEDMIHYAYIAVRQFPKAEKFTLVSEIKMTMWRLLRLIITCNRRYYKKTILQELDTELDVLRSQIRLAMELKFLSFKKYETWSRLLDEIGRMIGGWMKSIK